MPVLGIPTAALVNAQSASGPGIDFAITVRPTAGLELRASLGWNDLTMDANTVTYVSATTPVVLIRKGARLNYSPEYTSGLSAAYNWSIGGGYTGRFSASGSYTTKEAYNALVNGTGVVLSGDPQLDVGLALSISAPEHWSATAYCDNLTNNYGGSPPFSFPVEVIMPRPRPRTVGMHIEYKY